MRIPNAEHESRAWRIREIAPDFTLEDVWALPVHGGADDFQALLENMSSFDPEGTGSLPARMLFLIRDQIGRRLGIDSDPDGASLRGRLPDDLRDTAVDLRFGALPFVPLYRTDDEFAAEISNRTVHGVIHLAWVDEGEGRYQGQMAIYVKPRGALGRGYMALIKPFRYWVVYPALMRQIERQWNRRYAAAGPGSGSGGSGPGGGGPSSSSPSSSRVRRYSEYS
jgi:hypothetical protein